MKIYGLIIAFWNGTSYSVTGEDIQLFATKEARDKAYDSEPKTADISITKFEKELEE